MSEVDDAFLEKRRTEREGFQTTLTGCENEGCFGSDPSVFDTMLYMDDSGVRAHLNRVALAAQAASEQGLPLEDAAYSEVSLDTVSVSNPDTFLECHTISFGKGDEKKAGELDENSWGARVARCAYQCAQAQSCPLTQNH